MHTSLKNITERAQKCDFSVNCLQQVRHFNPSHCVFPLNIALKKTFPLKCLKNITEIRHFVLGTQSISPYKLLTTSPRPDICDILCQKVDVIFRSLIEQHVILCQKVDITRHCVFPLNIALKKTFQL